MNVKRLLVGLALVVILLAAAGIVLAASLFTYSAAPGLAIPDSSADVAGTCDGAPGTPAVSEIVVGEAGTIEDLNVSLNISHTFVGDLVVTLTHVETGTTVTLIDRPGRPAVWMCGFESNNIIVTLDDSAGAAAEATNPVAGTLRPNGALAAFNGQSIQGTWRLSVTDYVQADVGTLNTWGLQAMVEPIVGWSGWDPGDGRLNPDPAAPAAVYLRDGALRVYLLDDSAHGWEALDYPTDEIAARCAVPPAENTLLASEDGGRVRLYCLTTGEIQLNVFAGSVEVVYVWDVLPGWRYQITYAFNTATGEEISRHVDFPK